MKRFSLALVLTGVLSLSLAECAIAANTDAVPATQDVSQNATAPSLFRGHNDGNSDTVTIYGNQGSEELNIPCPPFWSVEPNPSVENSLSYVHDSGKIAVSVTYIADKTGSQVGAETFSRVAAEQMNCSLPVRSNLLVHAWSFDCENDIEALVYGDPGNLVLLSISGRNEDTENYLESFIKFLSYQAGSR